MRIIALSLSLMALLALATGCITATSTATGLQEIPGEHYWPEAVTNGDFVISAMANADSSTLVKKVGDGWNEVTDWTFDFTHEEPVQWSRLRKITSATLELHLWVDGEAYGNDKVRLKFFAEATNFLDGVSPKTHTKVKIDLLQVCTGEEILRQLARNKGKLPARYEDDAIVYEAVLTLHGHE